jgi:hypothetical protein
LRARIQLWAEEALRLGELMAAYGLSKEAVTDLDGIYEYTILNFGLE